MNLDQAQIEIHSVTTRPLTDETRELTLAVSFPLTDQFLDLLTEGPWVRGDLTVMAEELKKWEAEKARVNAVWEERTRILLEDWEQECIDSEEPPEKPEPLEKNEPPQPRYPHTIRKIESLKKNEVSGYIELMADEDEATPLSDAVDLHGDVRGTPKVETNSGLPRLILTIRDKFSAASADDITALSSGGRRLMFTGEFNPKD